MLGMIAFSLPLSILESVDEEAGREYSEILSSM